MSLFDGALAPTPAADNLVRNARYEDEPGFYSAGNIWLYGNVRLLHGRLGCVISIGGRRHFLPSELNAIEKEAESLVLDGRILVCGVHNEGYMRAALVPLRWGTPRIVVFSGGFRYHLGDELKNEPFGAARLWRYAWDPQTDLAVSLRAPDKKPTYAFCNPTIDRLVEELASGTRKGFASPFDPLGPYPPRR